MTHALTARIVLILSRSVRRRTLLADLNVRPRVQKERLLHYLIKRAQRP